MTELLGVDGEVCLLAQCWTLRVLSCGELACRNLLTLRNAERSMQRTLLALLDMDCLFLLCHTICCYSHIVTGFLNDTKLSTHALAVLIIIVYIITIPQGVTS